MSENLGHLDKKKYSLSTIIILFADVCGWKAYLRLNRHMT